MVFSGCGGGSDGGDTDESIKEQTAQSLIDKVYSDNIKSTYETTEEYELRIDEKLNSLEDTTMNVQAQSWLSAGLFSKNNYSSSYDADTSTFDLEVRFDYRELSDRFLSDATFTGHSLAVISETERSEYNSTNGFGAPATVSKQDIETHSFVFSNIENLLMVLSDDEFEITESMVCKTLFIINDKKNLTKFESIGRVMEFTL